MGKFFILSAANIVFGAAALAILLRGTINLPLFHPYFAQGIGLVGPIPLLVSALWSAVKLWQVRQVSNLRKVDLPDISDALARGDHNPQRNVAYGPAAPELLARGLIWMAVFALPVWLGWSLPFLWPAHALWPLGNAAVDVVTVMMASELSIWKVARKPKKPRSAAALRGFSFTRDRELEAVMPSDAPWKAAIQLDQAHAVVSDRAGVAPGRGAAGRGLQEEPHPAVADIGEHLEDFVVTEWALIGEVQPTVQVLDLDQNPPPGGVGSRFPRAWRGRTRCVHGRGGGWRCGDRPEQ